MELSTTVTSSTPPHSLRRSNPRRKIIYACIILRRRRCLRYCLLLPSLYLLGLIICACSLSLLFSIPAPPGSIYRSHEIFQKLRADILADNAPPIELSTVWRYRKLKEQKPCQINSVTERMVASEHNGYLIVEANGGLNQQRSSICNAVAVAALLNATLVIPRLEYHNVWQDLRISVVLNDEPMFFILSDLKKSSRTDGKYVSIHLRFEVDMVAFSCCIYDGGKREKYEMDLAREKGSRGKFKRRGNSINPGLNRISGKCPNPLLRSECCLGEWDLTTIHRSI